MAVSDWQGQVYHVESSGIHYIGAMPHARLSARARANALPLARLQSGFEGIQPRIVAGNGAAQHLAMKARQVGPKPA